MTGPYPLESMRLEMWLVGLLGVAASVEDLARRTISNWICLAALAGGIACQMMANGWIGAWTAVLGAAAGFAIFLIFYILGGMGGGDVKLMAGFGSMLGVGRLLEAAFLTALAGGLVAAITIGVASLRRARQKQGNNPAAAVTHIPYAPAIVIGVWLTLISGK